ncbi:MAG: phosphatidate cytidylyltransferase [Planctomycetales bacterium]|nr:phosphatidate cytidylyltransferase [Planctomycetales bacterium]
MFHSLIILLGQQKSPTGLPHGLAPLIDWPSMILLGVTLLVLGAAYLIGQYLHRQPDTVVNSAIVQALNNRVRAWWFMYAIMGLTFAAGNSRIPAVVFFFFISFWALREFITLTPTRIGDHRALFWVFFVFAPLQYFLLALGLRSYKIAGLTFDVNLLFANLIPVYASLFIPARIALAGDHKRFLERVAKIQCGLLICVFALSHAPALLDLDLHSNTGRQWNGGSAGLLLFFILVVQLGDVFQFVWSQLWGRRVIAEGINASKTWEGFFGGTISATLLGAGLWWVTPFSPLQAAGMSMMLSIMGFAGSFTMSAIKRDRGVSDYGTLVEGHVGVLDRFDSICFAAPVFYHVTRFLFT